MNDPGYFGYKGYILKNNGEILYDADICCIAHFSYYEDIRYYVRCKFPVKVGLHETSCPEIWTENENEAKYLLDNPNKVVEWLRERINNDPSLSRYVDQPIIEKEHKLPNYGGDPQLLAKTPRYIIFKCHWKAYEQYWLASDPHAQSQFDSAPIWSYTLTKEQAAELLSQPENIIPFYRAMQKEYPLGH